MTFRHTSGEYFEIEFLDAIYHTSLHAMSQNESIQSQSAQAEHQHIAMPDDKERLKRAPYARTRKDFKGKYTGKCFCETVQFEIAEDPLGMLRFDSLSTRTMILKRLK